MDTAGLRTHRAQRSWYKTLEPKISASIQIVKALAACTRATLCAQYTGSLRCMSSLQIMAYYEGLAMLLVSRKGRSRRRTGMIAEPKGAPGQATRDHFQVWNLLPAKAIFTSLTQRLNGDRLKRTSAIEFLDNTLKKDYEHWFFPCLKKKRWSGCLPVGNSRSMCRAGEKRALIAVAAAARSVAEIMRFA